MINRSIYIPVNIFKTHIINQIHLLATHIAMEVQQTEIEKLAGSFELPRFTIADRLKNSSIPWRTVLIFFGFLFTPVITSRGQGK